MKRNDCVSLENQEYVLYEKLGEGSNGEVWSVKANDTELFYAIKFLRPEIGSNHKKMKRFEHEIDFRMRCEHPNIIKIYSQGIYNDNPFYLMPKYEKTLRNIIDSESDFIKIIDYILQICEGIKYIHMKSVPVIHRDIKPENIFIGSGGKLVIADFGIAHFVDSELTDSNDLLCNRNYFAPEQIKGKAKNVTTACDVYALGLIINELFTKNKPVGTKFLRISDINPLLFQFDDVVYNCLKQDPQERPSIEEVYSDIILIKEKLLKILDYIEENIYIDICGSIPDKFEKGIVKQASKDILIAKYFFENKSIVEMEFLNTDYHLNIRYRIDDVLKNIYFQNVVYSLCVDKFNYEANRYDSGKPYESLNLKFLEHNALYQNIRNLLMQYPIDNEYEDLSGKILKLFSSCCDYHCKEILKSIDDLENQLSVFQSLPIIDLIYRLKSKLPFDTINEIDLLNHIYVDGENTLYTSFGDDRLYICDNDDLILKIRQEFIDKWSVLITKKDSKYYSVKFKGKEQYNKFKIHALKVAEPYYVFEGDVLDSLKIHRECDGFVELVPWYDFEMINILPRLL